MRRAVVLAVFMLQGCAAYNANYKANKYASEARKLDREGRTIEASGYWGRASVKADSVLARSPNGKYAAGAMAIKGEAAAAVGQCSQASRLLPAAIEQLKDEADREQAIMALAACELRLGSAELAASTVLPVTESRDEGRRQRALLLLGTAQVRTGNYPAALQSLAGISSTPALVQRTLAYAGAHDRPASTSAFDSLVALRDSMLPWDSLITITGRADPELASQFTTTLVASKTVSMEHSATLAFADAARLATVDTTLERERYLEIIQATGPGTYSDRARFELARMRVYAADSMADLATALEQMQSAAANNQNVLGILAPLKWQIQQMQRIMDSAAPGEPQGDMRRFLGAEYARDSLLARRLAASIFLSIPQGWPESPYAAKAWLAGRQLTGDTLDTGGQFNGSPYMAVLRGEEDQGFVQLEDSLATFARSLAVAVAPKPATVTPGKRADGTTSPADDDEPTLRRRQQRPRPSGATNRVPTGAGAGAPK